MDSFKVGMLDRSLFKAKCLDLLHTDPMSELYQRKVTKARQSLNEACSVRSIVRTLRDSSLKHQLTIDTKMERGQFVEIELTSTTNRYGCFEAENHQFACLALN
jgi:hypothetical protein